MVLQVGGDHYSAAYQHWDWVADTKLGYLEGCASKYVTRWRKKGGTDDLEKARSYLLKTRDLYLRNSYFNVSMFPYKPEKALTLTEKFIGSCQLGQHEAHFCRLLISWEAAVDLEDCVRCIDRIAQEASVAGQRAPGRGAASGASTAVGRNGSQRS